MNKRIRRFGLPKKKPTIDPYTTDQGCLTWHSQNQKWILTVDRFSVHRNLHGRKFHIPLTGRVINNVTGHIEFWLRSTSGDVRYDHPELLPVYVKHAVERVDSVAPVSFSKKSFRKVSIVKRGRI